MIHTSMFQKHIHKVKFYPSADDFTQALLVMLVTNIMSGEHFVRDKLSSELVSWTGRDFRLGGFFQISHRIFNS